MTTYMASEHQVDRNWYLVDAKGKTLGRLASELASRLRGKHKAIFTPHADTGDYFVVINSRHIQVTGRKQSDKLYYRHSSYPGGLKKDTFAELQDRVPHRALELAVKGMLPKGPLGRQMFSKLKVYADDQHPHLAQQPKLIDLEDRG